MYVWNPTLDEVTTKVAGNYFVFPAGKKKIIYQPEIRHFIATDRKETGLVCLPDQFSEDPEFEKTPEGKKILEELKEQAINAVVSHHRRIIANNQVSLRRELEQANIKTDPAVLVSPGELKSMQIVAKYQRASQDAEQAKVEEVRKLMKEVTGK